MKIAEEKYNKIITKIEKYFKLYKRSSHSNQNFWLLYYRLLNILYGVTSFDKYKRKMKFGLGYNYRYVNDEKQIYNLINHIKSLVYSSKLSTKERSIIFSLIDTKYSSLDLLQKRFNYTKLTATQLTKIAKRLNITSKFLNLNVLFREIYMKT